MSQAAINRLPAPGFWRRVACNLYEQLVLLGVVALTFLLPNLALGMLFQITLPSWLTFFYLYGVLGLYFVWYWTRTGQTLAMQTWQIQLLSNSDQILSRRRAISRYIYGSLWLLPCIVLQGIFHFQQWQIIELLFVVALLFSPLSIFLDRRSDTSRQSWPDRFAQTKLVQLPRQKR
ncbi:MULTISPECIES: RDD family protein [unclassified Polynucleobacter]|uniref:RDD family protein n=1 Tax=unclassified Polynucleobacter TaxID=2640945 RepID=UPI001F408DB6|nr:MULTISPECIES: RDD family protein [unclassified Polynucleobacter]MCE7526988.1 RDD family protein [Polynucleobacter sp. IMCC 30228]MCE7529248.1 RDD family protein [Polynucleobacter sp. IMCC 29146]